MTAPSTTKFCAYCRLTKPVEGFKFVIHPGTLSKRAQCTKCQDMRKKPREELERMAKAEAVFRARVASEASKNRNEERRKHVE